jgi:hypothetical protein
MNQVELGSIVGKAYQTVRNYETGIGNVPDDVIAKLKTLAAEKGLAHLALELSSDDWKIRSLVHPPQDFSHHQAKILEPALDARRQSQHALLDALLDSSNPDAVLAIDHLLRYFLATLPAVAKPPEKPAARAAGQKHAK